MIHTRHRLAWLSTVALVVCLCATPAAASFESCVKSIRAEVLNAGVKPEIVDAAFKDIVFDEKAVRFSRTQPEYIRDLGLHGLPGR